MPLTPSLPLRALAAACALSSCAAFAAGGHFAVDDADILEPGGCKAETWYERSSQPGRALHLGAGCRVGPVELVLATEPQRQAGTSFADHSVQVKWGTEIAPGWNAGLLLQPGWQSHARPRYQGTAAIGLLSWSVLENVRLHANLGRDFVHRGSDQGRGGVNVEWAPRGGAWKVIGERYREEGGHFARAGLRWSPGQDWKVDLSRAVVVRGPGDRSWTLGLTREFDR